MMCQKDNAERMTILCVKTFEALDLLHAIFTINEHDLECCGLVKQQYKDGRLWQWWLLMDAQKDKYT